MLEEITFLLRNVIFLFLRPNEMFHLSLARGFFCFFLGLLSVNSGYSSGVCFLNYTEVASKTGEKNPTKTKS